MEKRMRLIRSTNRRMNKKGFTLAEVLIVIGILSILFSIGALTVVQYQRNLKLTEMDGIARQIFLTAQNYITASKTSGQWEQLERTYSQQGDSYFGSNMTVVPSDYPAEDRWPANGQNGEHRFRYITYNKNDQALSNTILSVILPFGSIDEHVRTNGQYIIEYDYETAAVYGVWYTESEEALRYETHIVGSNGLNNGGREASSEAKDVRKNYKSNEKSMIIGYYGGAVAASLQTNALDPLDMEITNEETLTVTITDPNYKKYVNGVRVNTALTITVTGVDSKASKVIPLKYDFFGRNGDGQGDWWSVREEGQSAIYTLVLDDITKQGGQFAYLFPDHIPGENIIIQAVAESQTVDSIPARVQGYTNSLFAAKYEYKEDDATRSKVTIQHVRHLQNLSKTVSNVSDTITYAEQIASLDMKSTIALFEANTYSVYAYHPTKEQQALLCTNAFYSIENTSLTTYKGNGHTLRNFVLQENKNGNAGLFAQIGTDAAAQTLTVTNITLDGFSSESNAWNGNAGAFVGEVKDSSRLNGSGIFVVNPTIITNGGGSSGGIGGVLINSTLDNCGVFLADTMVDGMTQTASEKYERGAYHQESNTTHNEYVISAWNGSAGGVGGQVENSTITNTFAALPIITREGGISGGLIGTIAGSYEKATTIANSYAGGYTQEGVYSAYHNVAGLGNGSIVGGLIGKDTAFKTTIKNSYATTSTYGTMYVGGFIGLVENGYKTYADCYITGAVNGRDSNTAIDGFIGKRNNVSGLYITNGYYLEDTNRTVSTTIEQVSKLSYEELIAKTKVSAIEVLECNNYDRFLTGSSYPFGMVTNAGATLEASTKTHYGDWPKKEEKSVSADVGVIYYEIVDGALYYHGYLANFSPNESNPQYEEVKTEGEHLQNGLLVEPGKYVSEDGYLILLPAGTDPAKRAFSIGTGKNNEGKRWTVSELNPFWKEELLPLEGFDVYYIEREINVYNLSYITIGENTNPYYPTFGDYVSFAFDLFFADSVLPSLQNNSTFYIRSARHLNNLNAAVWSLANRAELTFVQNLDISYEDVAFTSNGASITYTYTTLEQISASYKAEKYDSNGVTHGYVIKGLTVPMFGTIVGTSKVMGVTLLNSKVNGSAAFAQINEGLVESCSVRTEVASNNGYDAVTVTSNADASGFIATNRRGTIRNSYFVGTVTGNRASGFVDTNEQGIIENCYSNGIVQGTSSASGFVRDNNAGTVRQSFAVGSVVSHNGIAHGFMESGNGGLMENCYSALFNLSGTQVYLFGPGRGDDYINCVWLDHSWVKGEVLKGNITDTYERGVLNYYDQLAAKGTYPPTYATYKYNSSHPNIETELPTYPFEVISGANAYFPLEFWGDWPKQDVKTNIGLIHYKMIDGILYYHGYVTRMVPEEETQQYIEVKTPGYESAAGLPEQSEANVSDVSNEGYMVLIPDRYSAADMAVQYGRDTIKILEEAGNKISDTMMNQLTGLEGFQAYDIHLSELPYDVYKDQSIPIQIARNKGSNNHIIMDSHTGRFTLLPAYGIDVADLSQTSF